MNKMFLLLSMLLFSAFVFALSPYQAKAETVELKGYLIDKASYEEFLKYNDIEAKAKTYTREQAMTKEAKKSGYGVLVGLEFYPFDRKGDRLAYELLEFSYKRAGITVVVKGYIRSKNQKVARESINTQSNRDANGMPNGVVAPTTNREYEAYLNFGDKNLIEVSSLEEAPLPTKEETQNKEIKPKNEI